MPRHLALVSTLALVLLAVPVSAQGADESPIPPDAVMTRARQAAITPAEARARLEAGHARFLAGKPLRRDFPAAIEATASGQFPFATVLSCVDSRSHPEVVFDQGLGDIFTARIAGNFVDREMLGTLEFTSKVVGSKLIVVLGHTGCGAIIGACDDVEMGNLTTTLSHLKPAVEAVQEVPGERNGQNPAFVAAVTDTNVRLTMENIRKQSPILDKMIAQGDIDLIGGIYDVGTGQIAWLDATP